MNEYLLALRQRRAAHLANLKRLKAAAANWTTPAAAARGAATIDNLMQQICEIDAALEQAMQQGDAT